MRANTRRMLCSYSGKVVHFTQRSAQLLCNSKIKLKVYKCKHCGFFHVATKGKKK